MISILWLKFLLRITLPYYKKINVLWLGFIYYDYYLCNMIMTSILWILLLCYNLISVVCYDCDIFL
jgi:hypothetical protein